jgi:hypothetical protein
LEQKTSIFLAIDGINLSDIREFLVTNLGEVEDKQFQLFEPQASFEIACNEP